MPSGARLPDGSYQGGNQWVIQQDGIILGDRPRVDGDGYFIESKDSEGQYHNTYDLDLPVPDYPNDLNAMSVVESELPNRLRVLMVMFLAYGDESNWSELEMPSIQKATFATAAQRAEAYLRARNLWIP